MLELTLEGLTKKYGSKTAVNGFSYTMTRGVYGLLGANGSGKTTLLRMICGILEATEGTVCCGGMEIGKMGAEYRRILGYLPQNFGYYPEFTAKRFLMYLAALKALPRGEAEARSEELLGLVELTSVKNKKIKTFSGGMLRRLGIAQALLNDPGILVLDEPTSGLDPKERIRFRNIVSSLSKGRIIILSTHIVSDIEFIADEILLMKQGRIIEQGTTAKVTENMHGKVWEYLADQDEVHRMNDTFAISNLKNEGEKVRLRLVSDTCPCKGAAPVSPGLEDVYLYHFEEVSEHVEHLERRTI